MSGGYRARTIEALVRSPRRYLTTLALALRTGAGGAQERLPSFGEGIPVVAKEAMAMELPVVTTRIMGTQELIEDGTDGLLVPPAARMCSRRRSSGLCGRRMSADA